MSFNRKDLAENLLRLQDNAHWRHYVGTLEVQYNSLVEKYLLADHPDEATRGECRAYLTMLKTIMNNSPPQGTP